MGTFSSVRVCVRVSVSVSERERREREKERDKERDKRKDRGPSPVHTQHEEGGRDRGLGRKDQGPSPVRSNFNGSTLTSEGGGKQAGSPCSRAQKGRSVGD